MKLSGTLVAALAATLLLSTSCSDDSDPPPVRTKAAPSPVGAGDVSCPAVDPARQQVVDFRAARAGAPKLVADLLVNDLGGRDYCVAPESDDSPDVAAEIVSYSLVLPDGSNYGERYGTFAHEPSDELLNFPFSFHVYGRCRPLQAEIVVRDGGTDHAYRARTAAGPHCS